jgi:two-component system LytT family sensor kinase
LYENNDPEVRIEKELDFLRSYIGVQQQRLDQTCAVNVSGFEELSGFAIAPNLLLPIVENCFKHISSADDGSSFILIRAERKGDAFQFSTQNTAEQCADGHGPGIGLDNVKRRLELLYKDRYSYRIFREEHKFSTFLSISIT